MFARKSIYDCFLNIIMFVTKIKIPESPFKITHEDNILTLGSCFSENVGNKLKDFCFPVEANPFGVLYNPVSVQNAVYFLLSSKKFEEQDLFYNHSLWHSFFHSSLFSGVSKEESLAKINSRLSSASTFFYNTKFLFITFGTAWVYEHIQSGQIVANCHKLPSKEFTRYRLSVEDIVLSYTELIWKINDLIPNTHIIFTISPIRHWKDGAHENNISKGILHLAIDALQQQFENVSYFPAYEILLDELRDYRYYAEDMLHPSEVAVNYIWSRFSEIYFSKETLNLNKEVHQLRSDLAHRPFHIHSEEYENFLVKTNEKKESLMKKYPFLKID